MMEPSDLDAFINGVIDELTPAPVPDDAAERTLFHLFECPRRVIDEERLMAVLAAGVTLRNLSDYLISSAVDAAERAGIPKHKRLRSGRSC